MVLPTILVGGATGKIGGAVARELMAHAFPVRAMVRREDERSARLRTLGAEVIVADLGDPEAVRDAMRGAARAFFLPPFEPAMLHQAVVFATAAHEAKLEAVTGLSQWLASPSHPSLTTRQHWLADRLLAMMPNVGFTRVEPGYFADSYLALIDYAAHLGILPSLYGDSRNAPPSNEDIGRVAAAALMDPKTHAGRRYRPTGPVLLSERDIAVILSRVLDRTVRRFPMPSWMFLRAARLDGYGVGQMSNILAYIEDHKQGAFSLGAPTTDVFDVTGRQPEDFETIARRYAARPGTQRTIGNFATQLAKFMRVPVTPGFDLKGFRRGLHMPEPAHALHAPQSETWRREHGIPVMASLVDDQTNANAGSLGANTVALKVSRL